MKRYGRIVLLFTASAVYLAIGAGIFAYIEGPHEMNTRQKLNGTIKRFLNDNPTLHPANLTNFLRELMRASSEGVRLKLDDNDTILVEELPNWDWPNAFFFATTVVTTIGYGNLTPSTILGRSMCIWYAFIGIPLMAWLLAEVSIQCKKRGKILATKLDKCLQCCGRCNFRTRKIVKIFLIGIMAYTLAVLLPAGVYSYTQGWYYNTAHYYCFITLSTIGFGDVTPTYEKQSSRYYRFLASFYMVYGLAIIAIVLNVVQQIQRKQATKILQYCSSKGNAKIDVDATAVGNTSEISLQNSALMTDTDIIKRAFSLDDASYDSPVRRIAETIPAKHSAKHSKPYLNSTKGVKDKDKNNSWEFKSKSLLGYGLILYKTAI